MNFRPNGKPKAKIKNGFSLFLNFSARITVLRFTLKLLAIALKDMFNRDNSSIFEANFWYNGVR